MRKKVFLGVTQSDVDFLFLKFLVSKGYDIFLHPCSHLIITELRKEVIPFKLVHDFDFAFNVFPFDIVIANFGAKDNISEDEKALMTSQIHPYILTLLACATICSEDAFVVTNSRQYPVLSGAVLIQNSEEERKDFINQIKRDFLFEARAYLTLLSQKVTGLLTSKGGSISNYKFKNRSNAPVLTFL